jgi:hypothetical protein
MPIPECLKSGSAEEREWLGHWMEMMETKMQLLEAGFTLEKKPSLSTVGRNTIHTGSDVQPLTSIVVDTPKGYTPTPAQATKLSALQAQMAKIERDEKEKLATEKDKADVENEEYLLDLTEEHIRDPVKKMTYGPLVTAALKARIDAYHKEIRAVLSKKFRPAAAGGGGGIDPEK